MRASLTQEVVRRLLHCSRNLSIDAIQSILSRFAQKMLNSNHSIESTRITLVHGVTKYLEMLRRTKLDVEHPDYQPLHFTNVMRGLKGDSGSSWREQVGMSSQTYLVRKFVGESYYPQAGEEPSPSNAKSGIYLTQLSCRFRVAQAADC